jgi:hypothetical protein
VQKRRQWPSSARPTQLNANIEDAIATTDAKVTIVLTVSITEPPLQPAIKFCRTTFVLSRRESVSIDIESNCGWGATARLFRPQKTRICAT